MTDPNTRAEVFFLAALVAFIAGATVLASAFLGLMAGVGIACLATFLALGAAWAATVYPPGRRPDPPQRG